ncbi:MAG: hypothetical protein RDV48_15455 [Candidatus Eremiobacteraeota bacterium]|nr:hypothetical protein [Candidatus Eremiobacteraeota bacterium]
MKKMSPWPCQYGNSQARNQASAAGPRRGLVTAQCTFENGVFYTPLIGENDEIVIALRESIIMLDRHLKRKWEKDLCSPRTLAFWGKGKLVIGCTDGLAHIDSSKKLTILPLPDEFKKGSLTPFIHIVAGPSNNLYALTGDAVFCMNEDFEILWSENLAARFGLFGGWRMALSKGGQVFISGAFSWSTEDESKEYAGYLAALSEKGEFLWQKNHDLDSLPTSSGISLRLTTSDSELWLSDAGAACYDFDGNLRWRDQDEEKIAFVQAISNDNQAVLTRKEEVFSLSSQNNFHEHHIAMLNGWPHEMVMDSERVLYILTSEGLEGWSYSGEQIFEIKGIIGDRISIGNGYLVVSSRRGKITVVE